MQSMVTLIQSAADPHSGIHTAGKLSSEVTKGKLLRLHRGIYIRPEEWLSAPRWDRYLISCAALSRMSPGTIFCRESALAIYGVSLKPTPAEITVVSAYGRAGRRPQPPLTGKASETTVRAMLRGSLPGSSPGRDHRLLAPIPVRGLEPPLPRGISRRGYRQSLAAGEVLLAEPRPMRPRLSDGTVVEQQVLVEPVEQALVTSVAHMDMAFGVIAADSARRGVGMLESAVGREDIAQVEPLLRTGAMRSRFGAAWNFSDPRSESAGESYSRVLIHQLGFAAPTLQQCFTLTTGRQVRVDFWWEEAQLIGEFDGLLKYRQPERFGHADPAAAVIEEKRREDGLRGLGCGMLRWGWEDLERPRSFAQKLAAAGVPRS